MSINGIYTDLIHYLIKHGHRVTVICPEQRRNCQNTQIDAHDTLKILRVKTLNITGQCHLVEKGLGLILLEHQFIQAIKLHLANDHFDCVLYSTPPMTFGGVVSYLKKRDKASTYLLLKDIMPQGAVDLGLFSKFSPPWVYFRWKEKQLYAISDHIGCMSPANCSYVLKHNPTIDPSKVEVNPNSLFPRHINRDRTLLTKYGISQNKTIFVYGGNLGRPQGIDFLLQCIASNENRNNTHFVVAGTGSERKRVEHFFEIQRPQHSTLLPYLPKAEYESLCAACNVGLVFLDKRFTFPNFPSRILSYMQAEMPYIAAVDSVTDVGTIAETNNFGMNCLWGDIEHFNYCVETLAESPTQICERGQTAKQYFLEHYTVEQSYQIIMQHFKRDKNV